MLTHILKILSKIDYRLSSKAFSRAQVQVEVITEKLMKINAKKFTTILDVGGGYDGRYITNLKSITKKYQNLELSKGENVDIIGSAYKIPIKSNSIDLVTMFMVLEHLNEPSIALLESHRVLKDDGLISITTVQYWHTHSYPSDYFRYTKYGLSYLFEKSGFEIKAIWSHGGPFLVIFHAIELNLPDSLRVIYSIFFYRLMNWLDWIFFKHEDIRKPNNDSVGWSVIAKKI